MTLVRMLSDTLTTFESIRNSFSRKTQLSSNEIFRAEVKARIAIRMADTPHKFSTVPENRSYNTKHYVDGPLFILKLDSFAVVAAEPEVTTPTYGIKS